MGEDLDDFGGTFPPGEPPYAGANGGMWRSVNNTKIFF